MRSDETRIVIVWMCTGFVILISISVSLGLIQNRLSNPFVSSPAIRIVVCVGMIGEEIWRANERGCREVEC